MARDVLREAVIKEKFELRVLHLLVSLRGFGVQYSGNKLN
jgi:hypothetical protein